MTITLSEQAFVESYQESVQCQLFSENSDQAAVTQLGHKRLGTGYRHQIQLREIGLLIHRYDLQDDVAIFRKQPELPMCVEFGFRVSGNCSMRQAGQNFLVYGPRSSGNCLLPRNEQFLQVDIHLSSLEMLGSFMLEESVAAPAIEQLFENAMEQMYYQVGSTTVLMQTALNQLLNCPYQGLTKQIYLESKCYELVALKLEQLTAGDRPDATQPPSHLKSEDVERIHQAKDILITHLDNPPSLLELARQVEMNDYKLKKGFRQVFGTTAFGYLHRYRLEQAHRLLGTGELSVAEVAHKVGFADRSYFTKAFCKEFGLNPGAYRRSQRGIFFTG